MSFEVIEPNGQDGSHCGLTDWYEDFEKDIRAALAKGPWYEWTTNWYGSKKAIAWAQISCVDGILLIEVKCSDDFDTIGYGKDTIPHTEDLDVIAKKLGEVWDSALEDKVDNETYVGYRIMTEVEVYACYIGGKPQGEPIVRQGWVETYVKSKMSDCFSWLGDFTPDNPPGDFYSKWGFQGEYDIPEDTKKKLEEWAQENEEGEFIHEGFTITPWKGI